MGEDNFVEMDSYAIASSFLNLSSAIWLQRGGRGGVGNSMGLILEARS